MSLELLIQSVASGLLLGGIYGLIALPLALSFGVMRFLNFAHGDLLMCAMYGCVLLNKSFGLGPYTAALVLVPAMAVVGAMLFLTLIRPLLKSPVLVQAQFTLGLSFVIQSAAQLIFGADLFTVRSQIGGTAVRIGGVALGVPLLIGFGVAVLLSAGLLAFLSLTEWGYRVRATAQDRDMAELCGVPVPIVQAGTFAAGTACLGLAASCLMAFYQVTPHAGVQFSLLSLLIVVMGGLGDLKGTFFAGLILGVAESLASAAFNSAAAPATLYVLFGLSLVLRPRGLFGRGSFA